MSIESALVALLLGVLVARFVSLLERRPTDRLRLWIAAWTFTFLHVLLVGGSHHAQQVPLLQFADSVLILLGMECFLLSNLPSPVWRTRTRVAAFLLPGPLLCFSALSVFPSSRVCCGLAFVSTVLVCAVAVRGESMGCLRVSYDFCLCVLYAALGCFAIWANDRGAALHILLAALTGFNALALYRARCRASLAEAAHSLGFLLWAAMIPIAIWQDKLALATFSSAVWHFPKLFVAVCMLLSLLEDEIKHAQEAARGERRARLALTEAERQVRRLVENAPVGIYRSTPCGKILFANTALLQMLGILSFEHLAQLNIEEVSLCNVPRSEFRRILEKRGRVDGFESFCTRSDGTTILMREAAQVIYGDSGEVLYYEGIVEDVTERQRLHEELVRRAYHDPLTGLPNRELLEEHLQTALARSERSGTMTGLLCLDVDRFKQINDHFGHDAGDDLLKQLVLRLASRLRATDTFARVGGDEFMLVLADIRSRADAELVAQGLLDAMQQPFEVHGSSVIAGASVGVAVYPLDAVTAAELRRCSDQAMYRAKRNGRCRYETFESRTAQTAIS